VPETTPGYAISQGKRKRIEECFGSMKTIGGLRKTRHRGRCLVEWFFMLTATAYNLVRILMAAARSRSSAAVLHRPARAGRPGSERSPLLVMTEIVDAVHQAIPD
jgi:hypothetical protein